MFFFQSGKRVEIDVSLVLDKGVGYEEILMKGSLVVKVLVF